MAYIPTQWVNGQPPALNAENLNHIEAGIANAENKSQELEILNGEGLNIDKVSKYGSGGPTLIPSSEYYTVDFVFGGGSFTWNTGGEADSSVIMFAFDENMNQLNAWDKKATPVSRSGYPDTYKYVRVPFKYNGGGSLVLNGVTVWQNTENIKDKFAASYTVLENTVMSLEEVKTKLELLDDIATYIQSDNLVDNTKLTIGGVQSDGTILTNDSWANYSTSDFIRIEKNEQYTVSTKDSAGNPAPARIIALLFDEKKYAISSTYMNQGNVNSLTFSAGDAIYVRVASSTVYFQSRISLQKGTTAERFVPYKREGAIKSKSEYAGYTMKVDDSGLVIPENIPTLYNIKNYVDREKYTNGYLNADGSIGGTTTQYKTVELIPVHSGRQITIYPKTRMYMLYDIKGLPVQSTYNNTETYAPVAITPEFDGYIRATAYGADVNTFTIGEGVIDKSYATGTIEIKPEIIINNAEDGNPLRGKKWAPCGDSFTDYTNESFTDGPFVGKNKTYPRLIAERAGMVLDQTFFSSGRTLAYPADGTFTNSLTCPTAACYYQNIPEDVDYITIMLGINDGHHRSQSSGGDGEDNTGVIPLGTLSDSTTATYYGAWNVVLTWLLEHRPFAHIGILVSNGVDTVEYRTAQLEIAKKYGVPYIDLNGDDRTPAMIRSQNPDVSNTVKTILRHKQAVDEAGGDTHPNANAHQFESTFIEDFLRSL